MPFTQHIAPSLKWRILISGFSNTGKTTSLLTFIYGPHDPDSPDENERAEAIEYAANKHMVILTCPGEFGTRSLPQSNDHITSYSYTAPEGDDVTSVTWSQHALQEFYALSTQVIKEKPDILVIDGLHCLWEQRMNVITDGDYLRGVDLNINVRTGNVDPYRSAKFHEQAHNSFGQYLAALNLCSVPVVIGTTWEDWKSVKADGEKVGDISATRYLWPDIPGKMATRIVGKWDARLSARLEKRCFHDSCTYSKNNVEHHVWQVLPKNDVQGVGIKGLRKIPVKLKEKPWIHQDASVLWKLIAACT